MKRMYRLNELDDVAHEVAAFVQIHRIACFEGNLGAGKTTLIKAICKQLGVIDSVSSPTFSLLNIYRTSSGSRCSEIVHIDLYRISNEEEAVRAGIEEYVYSNACCLVEWPQRAPGILPDKYLRIHLFVSGEDERMIEVISAEN